MTDANDVPPILVNGRPFVVAGTPRLNQNLGAATIRYSDAQSFYNGLQIELKRRFSHGFQLQSAYTWAKNIDDSTTGVALTDFNEGAGSQAYNPKVDRGLSALSQSQTLVINGVYLVPSPIQSGFVSHFLGGWQLSSIFSVSSGTPFYPRISGRSAPDQSRSTGGQRPDLVAGRSFSSIVLGDPNQYFDPKAFVLPPPPPPGFPAGSGFYGNAGRNILIGPGFENFDLSLMKNTPLKIKEGDRLEFRAEFFNLFNRANFAVPSSLQVLNPANGQYIAGAGKISKTVSSSRQMQFGLKLIF